MKRLLVVPLLFSCMMQACSYDDLEQAVVSSDVQQVKQLLSKGVVSQEECLALIDLSQQIILKCRSRLECALCTNTAPEEKWPEAYDIAFENIGKGLAYFLGAGVVWINIDSIGRYDGKSMRIFSYVAAPILFFIITGLYARSKAFDLCKEDLDKAIAVRQLLIRYNDV